MQIRKYQPSDYSVIAPWFDDLSKFYDGHTKEKKLIDQLVNCEERDLKGFFTVSKQLYVCVDINQQVLGFFCLNHKRGHAVKLGPIVTSPLSRGKGVGKYMFNFIDIECKRNKVRKIYATTSNLNHAVNNLFIKYGYIQEALYPNHYKNGSNEIIWGKLFITDNGSTPELIHSLCLPEVDGMITVREFVPEKDSMFLGFVIEKIYSQWHNDLGTSFLNSIVLGCERAKKNKLDYQDKSKLVLVACDSKGSQCGLCVISPKRGGPCKIYPFLGSVNAQTEILKTVKNYSHQYGMKKFYTFCLNSDEKQKKLLYSLGFISRGILIQPYKPNTLLETFDFVI